MNRRPRRTSLVLCAALGAVTVTALPARAVGRSTLQNNLDVAAYDYSASSWLWTGFPSYDKGVWSGKSRLGRTYLAAAQAKLDAAKTQAQIDAVAPTVYRERTRARVFRLATVLGDKSFDARRAAISTGQSSFTQHLEGSLADPEYTEARDDSAAVAALAAKDRRRAWAALLTTTAPGPSEAAAAVPALTSTARATAPEGWTGLPGGCALPSAAPEAWLGHAAEPGVHLWTNQADIDAARVRALTATEGLAYTAHTKLMQAAAPLHHPITDDTDLPLAGAWVQKRTQRLGYAALVAGDTDAASWLRDDLARVLLPGPKAASVLRDSVTLESLATDLDWLGVDEEATSDAALLREALVVRWLAPLSCRYEGYEPVMTGEGNITIAANSAVLLAGYALAPSQAPVAAAVVRTALQRLVRSTASMVQDGGSYEGPSYWNLQARYLAAVYGTTTTVYAGLTRPVTLASPGAAPTYAWSSTDARGVSLPFADSYRWPERLRPGLVSWMAHKTGNAQAGAFMRASLASPTEAFQVFWWPTDAALAADEPPRASRLFKRTGLAALQADDVTAWLKGGSSKDSHTHLDQGLIGFVKHGIAWAVDPGQGDYSLPQYSSRYATSKRWTYWKVSASGHSELSPPGGMPPLRTAPFTSFAATSSNPAASNGAATVDLRQVLPGSTTATRTAWLSATGALTVNDRVVSSTSRAWVWRWVTDADISISGTGSGRTVTLTRDGHTVTIALRGLPWGSSVSVVTGPSDALGPDGRQLRVVTLTLGATTDLRLSALVF